MQRFLEAEGKSCLVKPFSIEEFRSAIANFFTATVAAPAPWTNS